MQKTIDVTLGGMITGKSFIGEESDRIYSIIFKRADRREMKVTSDRQTFDRCVEGNLAIFNIEVVMDHEGDINHYDKKLSYIKNVQLVGVDVDAEEYHTLMENNLTWLSRYAKPLNENEEKKKDNLLFALIGMVFLVVGLLCISITPVSLINRVSDGKKYENYTHIEGKVTYQNAYLRPGKNSKGVQTYDVSIIVTYYGDGKEYSLSDKIYSDDTTVSEIQDLIYNNDDPTESYLASYDVIAKTYIPDGNDSIGGFMLLIVVTLILGIIGAGIGIYFLFEVLYVKFKRTVV